MSLDFLLELFGFCEISLVEGFAYFRDGFVGTRGIDGRVGFSGPESYVVEGDSLLGGIAIDDCSLRAVADDERLFEEIGWAVEFQGQRVFREAAEGDQGCGDNKVKFSHIV